MLLKWPNLRQKVPKSEKIERKPFFELVWFSPDLKLDNDFLKMINGRGIGWCDATVCIYLFVFNR